MKKLLFCLLLTSTISSVSLPFYYLYAAETQNGYVLLAPSIVGKEGGNVTVGQDGETFTFGEYLEQIYITALIVAVIATIVTFVYGGITYIWPTPGAKSDAKTKMTNAIIGLILALTSWLLLNTINPKLTIIDGSIFGDLKKSESAPPASE
ncbi:MAG: hypothetical protein AAB821_01910 [Patescibacteria group bacterium]